MRVSKHSCSEEEDSSKWPEPNGQGLVNKQTKVYIPEEQLDYASPNILGCPRLASSDILNQINPLSIY